MCQKNVYIAFNEIEEFLLRLEAAEALYPSSRAMGACHSLYNSKQFVNRVKAMCQWYNIVTSQRNQLVIVGQLFRK